jgi:hypothetical protein
MSYPGVTIGLFLCYLLGPTSSWAVMHTWSLIFNGPLVWVKLEMPLLAPEHIIKLGEHQFLIGLPMDWQSPIGRLCPDQVDQLLF